MSENWFRLLCIAIMISMLWFMRMCELPRRGFWCDDHSIRYPHLPMVMDYKLLLAISISFPLILFQLLPSRKSGNKDDNDTDNEDDHLSLTAPSSPGWDYMFGFLVNLVLTTFCKIVIARPRPNFYHICQPTVQCDSYETRFISEFNCTTEPHLSLNSIQSFFSGHSSTGTYAGLFSALHVAAHWPINYNIKALTCTTLIILSLFPGFTQYLNHWHHWSDVLVGQTVGFLLAVAAFQMRYWLRKDSSSNFHKKTKIQATIQ